MSWLYADLTTLNHWGVRERNFQIGRVRAELSFKTPSWYLGELLGVGGESHIFGDWESQR